MFINVNGINYNVYSIASFVKRSSIEDGTDDIIQYSIIYELTNGNSFLEHFETKEERDAKYDQLVTKFGSK